MCCIVRTLQITVFSLTEPRSVDLFDEQALWVTAAKGLASILTRAAAKAVGCDTVPCLCSLLTKSNDVG